MLDKANTTSLNQCPEVKIEIISFSGTAGFEDQILSIYSFLSYAGVPKKWIVYSDKTYSEEQIKLLKGLFPFVSVRDWDVFNHYRTNSSLKKYLQLSGLAKKLNIIIGHPYNGQTFYIDSDVIFYKNFKHYINSPMLQRGLWFISDLIEDVGQFLKQEVSSVYPLNSGFLGLNEHFNASDIYEYLERLNGNFGYFSEQSAIEYAFRRQHAQLLDPRQFIIDTSDQFHFKIKYQPEFIAMRHYTSPVRHKMWQNGWSWHLRAGTTR